MPGTQPMENLVHKVSTQDQPERPYAVPPPEPAAPAAPTPGRSTFIIGGVVLAILLGLAVFFGIRDRSEHERDLATTTDAAAIPTVNTTYPTAGGASQEIILPGNVQAFIETPIYARTNGYLKKWYFDIGAHVKQGQLLATIETPELDQQLDQSRAELERIQANADLAGVTSDRWQALLAKHAVSQQEADQNKSNYIAAQAAVDASRANVRRLEQLQSYERITAPFDGVITARNTDIGDLIDAGAGSANPRELFHLASVQKLRVFVALPEIYADNIHDGNTATISQDSNPGKIITGKIVRNSNAINTTTRTLNVEVDIDNSKGELLPGAYVFVHFALPPGTHVVTIPSNALLFRAEGLRVAVVHGNKVELRPITIGHDYGGTVEVTSGVDIHDQIILDPADSLISGATVHPNLLKEKGAH
jgi:RND family efflux transporter MFP subunit